MPDSYPFPIFSGLLEPKHYNRIGNAVWFFIWCISSTTKEEEAEGVVWGRVLGSKPMKLSELAEPFGVDSKTVSRWIKSLEEHGYIRVTRAPYGLIIAVKNSKKYRERVDKNVRSEEGEQTDLSDLSPRDETEMSDLPDKNVRSNKDIIKILIDRWINGLNEDDQKELSSRSGVLSSAVGAFSTGQIDLDRPTTEQKALQIEQYFMQRKGALHPVSADWKHLCEVANEDIPLDLVCFFIDLAFARKKATRTRPTDQIRLFSYCKTVILTCWDELQAALSKPAIRGSPEHKPKSDRQMALLEQLKREEIAREQNRNH